MTLAVLIAKGSESRILLKWNDPCAVNAEIQRTWFVAITVFTPVCLNIRVFDSMHFLLEGKGRRMVNYFLCSEQKRTNTIKHY